IARHEKTLGADSAAIGPILLMVAQIWDREGRPALAAPLYERVEVIYRKALAEEEARLGPDAQALGYPIDNLARLLQARRQHAEAGQLFRRSLALAEKHSGRDHPAIIGPV